jgi:AcrR family transcriptional regulator
MQIERFPALASETFIYNRVIMEDTLVRSGLVDAARNYFVRFCYSRVSTAEIAEQAGRSKKTLYKHFPTKEALLGAVLEHVNQDMERQIIDLLEDRSVPAIELVRQVFERVAVHVASVSNTLLGDLEGKEPSLYLQARSQQRQMLAELLSRLLMHAGHRGVLRSDIDLRATVETFLTSVEALGRPDQLAINADRPTTLFTTLVGWVVAGIAAEGKASQVRQSA